MGQIKAVIGFSVPFTRTIHGTAVSGGARGGGAGSEATPVMGGGRKALGGPSGSQPISFANTFYSSFVVLADRVRCCFLGRGDLGFTAFALLPRAVHG